MQPLPRVSDSVDGFTHLGLALTDSLVQTLQREVDTLRVSVQNVGYELDAALLQLPGIAINFTIQQNAILKWRVMNNPAVHVAAEVLNDTFSILGQVRLKFKHLNATVFKPFLEMFWKRYFQVLDKLMSASREFLTAFDVGLEILPHLQAMDKSFNRLFIYRKVVSSLAGSFDESVIIYANMTLAQLLVTAKQGVEQSIQEIHRFDVAFRDMAARTNRYVDTIDSLVNAFVQQRAEWIAVADELSKNATKSLEAKLDEVGGALLGLVVRSQGFVELGRQTVTSCDQVIDDMFTEVTYRMSCVGDLLQEKISGAAAEIKQYISGTIVSSYIWLILGYSPPLFGTLIVLWFAIYLEYNWVGSERAMILRSGCVGLISAFHPNAGASDTTYVGKVIGPVKRNAMRACYIIMHDKCLAALYYSIYVLVLISGLLNFGLFIGSCLDYLTGFSLDLFCRSPLLELVAKDSFCTASFRNLEGAIHAQILPASTCAASHLLVCADVVDPMRGQLAFVSLLLALALTPACCQCCFFGHQVHRSMREVAISVAQEAAPSREHSQ